jgi:hypothetical protein
MDESVRPFMEYHMVQFLQQIQKEPESWSALPLCDQPRHKFLQVLLESYH